MASERQGARKRLSRAITDKEICSFLDESDLEDFPADSDEDAEYLPLPPARGIQPETSSSSSEDEIDDIVAPSPVLSENSAVVHAETFRRPGRRGRSSNRSSRRGARRGARSVSTRNASRQTREVDVVDTWTAEEFNPPIHDLMQPAYPDEDFSTYKWHEFYDQYIDDEILITIVDCTNRTEVLAKGRSLGLTLKELKVYVGITMIMSSLMYPQLDMCWSEKWRVPVIVRAMNRNRFFAIRARLKVVYDQDISPEQRQDKIWKVRPLLDRIRKACLKQPRPKEMCVDEMIIPFTGQCSMRQYCPNKPNPVGLKVFVLASPQGIVCDMVVYQGDSTFPHLINEGFGLGEAAVLELTQSLVPGHVLFFDRYFTSIKLCEELLRRGFHGTGTIMRNRIPKQCILPDDKTFRKQPRGTSAVKIRDDGKLATTMWLDNKPVVLLSSCYSNLTEDECDRWSKKEKRYERVKRPEVIRIYNQNMGGVDLADRMLSVCPSRNRTNKWTIRVISHLFDLAVVNSWLQYRAVQVQMGKPKRMVEQLREYKLNLGEKLLCDNDTSSDGESDPEDIEDLLPKHKKRKVLIVPLPSVERRQQKAAHLPDYGRQSRCRNPACSKKTTVFCMRCKIYLCFTTTRNCFSSFHDTG